MSLVGIFILISILLTLFLLLSIVLFKPKLSVSNFKKREKYFYLKGQGSQSRMDLMDIFI